MKVRLGDREIEIYCPEQMDAAPESAPAAARASTFEYPMKMDKGFLACFDEKKLKNHLIHQLKYRDEDVIKLLLFLTKEYQVIFAGSTVNVILVTHGPPDVIIIPLEAFLKDQLMMRMILQCLNKWDRVKFLHTQMLVGTLMHHITCFERTGEILIAVLESVNEDQHYEVLSTPDEFYNNTPLHFLCHCNSSVYLGAFIIMMTMCSEKTRYQLLRARNNDKATPLHYAIMYGKVHVLQLLAGSINAHHFVDIMALKGKDRLLFGSKDGYTPMEIAKLRGYPNSKFVLQFFHTKALIDIQIEKALQYTDDTGNFLL